MPKHTRHTAQKNRWMMMTASRTAAYLGRLGLVGLLSAGFAETAFAASVGVNETPQGGVVAAGSASFSRPASNSLIVNQSSQRAVIDWQSFNIGANASTQFKQPGTSSVAVNRVMGAGADPTQILGTLKSNGQVMVLDRNGVLFGAGSHVDVGGLIASTGSIDTQKFMAGSNTINLTGMSTGTVENRGSITAKDGGLVALVAPHAANSGTITANLGRVELASGSAVTVDLYGDRMVQLVVDSDVANALAENSGTIRADGGRVAMTTLAAQGVVDDVINMTGVIRAETINGKGGRVILKGSENGTVTVGGTIDAKGASYYGSRGGYVEITGAEVSLNHATIDASGTSGGGTVYVGGGLHGLIGGVTTVSSNTTFSADSVVRADATSRGNGGTVVVWGGDHTDYYGTITARGGARSGNGGFVEVSTGAGVVYKGTVDTTAARGKTGTLLIDPASLTIGASGANISAATLANNLKTSDAIVSAFNNVDIISAIDLSAGTHNLTLSAPTLNVNGNVTMGATGNVTLQAGTTLNLNGTFISGGVAMTAPRLVRIAPQVNVLSSNADIQQALDIAAADATVSVAPGTYTGDYTITSPVTLTGNTGDPLTDGADPAAPVLQSAAAGGTIITVAAVPNVTIQGFNFSATGGGATGVSASGADNISINNNTFDTFSGGAISVTGGTNATLANNVVPATGGGSGSGDGSGSGSGSGDGSGSGSGSGDGSGSGSGSGDGSGSGSGSGDGSGSGSGSGDGSGSGSGSGSGDGSGSGSGSGSGGHHGPSCPPPKHPPAHHHGAPHHTPPHHAGAHFIHKIIHKLASLHGHK